jgi:uncharacterized protein YoxC
MADDHTTLLQFVGSIDARLAQLGKRFDAVQQDVARLRGETSALEESVNGLRNAVATRDAWVQRHIDQVTSSISDLRQMEEDAREREWKAAGFAKGREAERYRVVQFARKVLAVVSHRASIALAIALTAAVNGLRWWGW